ncbi:hypothetical protein BU14_0254s0028 [Porphyra umbilicalis]|uniref:Uncharacterized protein n=1 Tax=Porphyra umbilicalis TaxID=2786 RepID=A0A1X6P2T5_PORUM|nr:hypothetical protein BU14_0254s0028 [Porphyra umbilicalis]|eukprot:OSX75148.1 hypothetical protein BU14_0254s0028 [Porphyra umbilicalis]
MDAAGGALPGGAADPASQDPRGPGTADARGGRTQRRVASTTGAAFGGDGQGPHAGGDRAGDSTVAGGDGGAAAPPADQGSIPAKSSSNQFFPHVTIGIIKRWKDLVFVRGRRHERRGVAKRLQANNIADHLVSHDAWVQRLDVGGGKKMDKAAVSRIIAKAVKFNNEVNAIRLANTGAAPGVAKKAVKEHVAIKARTWRIGAKDARRILKYASKTCPVVGGVMRSPPPFGGSRPNDTPDKSGSDSQSDGDDVGGAGALDTEPDKTPSASDEGDSTSLESSDDGAPFAPMPTAEGAGRGVPSREDAVDLSPASATGVNVAGGASGRSRRAALAEASMEASMPGGADVMRSLAGSLSDASRRFDEKQKTKRLAAAAGEVTKRVEFLTALVKEHPHDEGFRDMLRDALRGGEPPE